MDGAEITIEGLLSRARAFEKEAHQILGIHETSPSRVVLLDETYRKLAGLSVQQDDLFRQALRCVENALFRAAYVMAWAAFMDFFEEKLAEDGLTKLRAIRTSWKAANIDQLRENTSEYQIIEAASALGLVLKNETRRLHGLLSGRNDCAHPSNYSPDLNTVLGYISELLDFVRTFQARHV